MAAGSRGFSEIGQLCGIIGLICGFEYSLKAFGRSTWVLGTGIWIHLVGAVFRSRRVIGMV